MVRPLIRDVIQNTVVNTVMSASQSWSSYWKPQSLVVEDAQPTKVVMTGLSANTNAVAGDFTIAGFTISSLARDVTNKILTLTLSTAVVYGDILTVVYKTKSYSVTNNISYIPTLGLIAAFEMNGNANDSSGNNLHLTAAGGIALTTDRRAAADKAYAISSVETYLKRDTFTEARLQSGTLSFWVKASSWGNLYPLVTYTSASLTNGYGVYYITGTNSIRFAPRAWNGTGLIDAPLTDTTNWHHVICTWNVTTKLTTIRIDGGTIYQNTGGSWGGASIVFTSCEFRVGITYARTEYHHGSLDQVFLWDRPLSDAEQLKVFNSYK